MTTVKLYTRRTKKGGFDEDFASEIWIIDSFFYVFKCNFRVTQSNLSVQFKLIPFRLWINLFLRDDVTFINKKWAEDTSGQTNLLPQVEFFKLINVTWKIFHITTILMDSFNTGLKVTIKNGQKNVKQLYQPPVYCPNCYQASFWGSLTPFFRLTLHKGQRVRDTWHRVISSVLHVISHFTLDCFSAG